MSVSYCTTETNVISALEDKPNTVGGLTAAQLKAKFDLAAAGIKEYINSVLVGAVNGLIRDQHTHGNKSVLDTLTMNQTALNAALDGKAAAVHTHTTEDVEGLDTALDGKANAEHTHTMSDITDSDWMKWSDIWPLVYPVGSIYISVSETSPETLFGGTWERIEDKFLLAAGGTYAAGSTGGEEEVTLTVAQMPSHHHTVVAYSESGSDYSGIGANLSYACYSSLKGWGGTTAYAGGGQPHNNMPPYLAVYMWKRTA